MLTEVAEGSALVAHAGSVGLLVSLLSVPCLTGTVAQGEGVVRACTSSCAASAVFVRSCRRTIRISSDQWADLVENGAEAVAFDLQVVTALQIEPESL